jgi:ligand-binding sensor domain-containing protein
MRNKILIITFLIVCYTGFVESQGVRLFTSADGLPSSQFTQMTQDQDGYIWICSYGGLAKFNGLGLSSFYESDRTDKLRSNRIFRFFTDQRGQCWVGTSRGLQLFRPENESFEHIILDKNENQYSSRKGKAIFISDIICLSDSKYLLINGGVDGYFVVDIISHKINEPETKKINSMLKGIISRRIFIDSKSRLWIASKRLHVLDTKTNKFIPISYSTQNRLDPEKMEITDFLEDKTSNILLISDKWNGVLFYDEEKQQICRLNSTIPHYYQSAQRLLKRKDGTLLVGCEKNGIGRINLNKKEITEYKIKESPVNIKECKIHSLIEDRWGNLFIGIYQKGLLVVPAATGKFNYKGITDSPAIQNRAAITSFTQNDKGTIYIGTDGYGVLYGKDFENLKQLQLPSSCNGAVQQLASIKNNIWIATYGSGLFLHSGLGSKVISDMGDIISKNASSLQFDALRQKLYIGTIGSGLNLLDFTSGKMSIIPLSGNQWVSALKLDSKGKLWIGN